MTRFTRMGLAALATLVAGLLLAFGPAAGQGQPVAFITPHGGNGKSCRTALYSYAGGSGLSHGGGDQRYVRAEFLTHQDDPRVPEGAWVAQVKVRSRRVALCRLGHVRAPLIGSSVRMRLTVFGQSGRRRTYYRLHPAGRPGVYRSRHFRRIPPAVYLEAVARFRASQQ